MTDSRTNRLRRRRRVTAPDGTRFHVTTDRRVHLVDDASRTEGRTLCGRPLDDPAVGDRTTTVVDEANCRGCLDVLAWPVSPEGIRRKPSRKIHLVATGSTTSACGHPAESGFIYGYSTDQIDEVTCGACLKALEG